MESINKEKFKKMPVTVGLMLWVFGSIVTVIIAVGAWLLADLQSDIASAEQARKDWVKDEFKPHLTKFDNHVIEFNKVSINVGIVVDRTNSMKDRTQSIGMHNIETPRPDD